MKVSLMMQQTSPKTELFLTRQLNSSNLRRAPSKLNRISFYPTKAIWSKKATVRSEITVENKPSPAHRKSADNVRLFVGLPLDVVSDRNTVNHAKAIAAGMRALKLLGVHGIDLPVSWAVVQPDSSAHFNWSGYLAVAAAASAAGLRLRLTLRLDDPLPKWIVAAGNPDLLFTDRSGRGFPSALSLAADALPLLPGGATPLSAVESLLLSLRSAFGALVGSTLTDLTVGLGPAGELRYPSSPAGSGAGEFQCYDKHMLDSLHRAAAAAGNPLWGLGGPHDAPAYAQSPDVGGFFADGGAWESPYGEFFLSWYSGELVAHADRLLSLARNVFDEMPLGISGKVPLIHNWYDTRSRAALLTAGYYHTAGRNGFDAVANVFAKNSVTMIVSGIDTTGQDQPWGVRSNPEALLSDILVACKRYGVAVAGENAANVSEAGFVRIKEKLADVDSFTYQRMGAYFFSPEHWPRFTEFVRSMVLPELDADDKLGGVEERVALPMDSVASKEREMQSV